MVHESPSGPSGSSDSAVSAEDEEFEAMVDQAEAADEAELRAFDLDDEKPPRQAVRPVETAAWVFVVGWVITSGADALLTRFICTRLDYDYPILLGAYHMTCAVVGTRILRGSFARFRNESIDMPRPIWLRTIMPLASLFASSLALSSAGAAHLSPSAVQVLTAFIPVFTLALLILLKMAQPVPPLLGALAVITLGLVLSAGRTFDSTIFGFFCQTGASFIEPARLVLIQIVIQSYSVSPASALYLYAPVAAILLGVSIPFSEGFAPVVAFPNIGIVVFLLSGLISFASSLAEVFLIDAAGALGGSLSAVLRNTLLVAASTSSISSGQLGGYIIALVGLCLTVGLNGQTANFTSGQHPISSVYKSITNGINNGEREGLLSRRAKLIAASAVAVIVAFSSVGFRHSGSAFEAMTPAWTATYPLATVPQPHYESEKKFTRWTVRGPGQQIIASYDPSIDVARLPRVAWVIVATEGEVSLYGQQFLAIQCYCARAGIPFILEHFIMVDDRHFLSARHRTTAKYLRFYQWVIVTDSDFVILDSNNDIRNWLDDSVDMVLTDRENGEICGCGYMVKNSPGGWSFLQRWVSWADHGKARMNQDNGDLIEMVHAGLQPGSPNNADNSGREISPIQTADNCLNAEEDWELYWVMNRCVGKVFNKLREADPRSPYWQEKLWAWDNGHPSPTIRVYKPFAGWIRSAGDSQGEWSGMPEKHLGVPGEFMGHGKHLERFLNVDSILCTGHNWYTEPRLDLEEARRYVVEELGYTAYWGCFDENGGYHCDQYLRARGDRTSTENGGSPVMEVEARSISS